MQHLLQALCESIRAELENDRLIAETGVFPSAIDLPAVTAPEYCHVSATELALMPLQAIYQASQFAVQWLPGVSVWGKLAC